MPRPARYPSLTVQGHRRSVRCPCYRPIAIARAGSMKTDDLRIRRVRPLLAPAILAEEIPITARGSDFVGSARQVIESILDDRDGRLLIVVGPCSIHDTKAALDYAG